MLTPNMANVAQAHWVTSCKKKRRCRTNPPPQTGYRGGMKQKTPGSDPIYKRLYAFAEMVEDLLRSLFPRELTDAVDWPSLGRLPAEYVGDDFRRRHGDAVWRVRLRDGDERGEWLYVLVLLEFQSTTDEMMALRVLQYTAMLYQELVRESRRARSARGKRRAGKGAAKPERLPPVLPVVLYNGDAKWRTSRRSATSCLTSATPRRTISACAS